MRAAHQRQRVGFAALRRQAEREVGLAGLGAHRGEVRQRRAERARADLPIAHPAVVEAEVSLLDGGVDGDDAEWARTHDGGVVSGPAHDPRATVRRCVALGVTGELGRDRLDQRALGDGAQRCR